jgi:stress-induced morphogen
MPIEKTELESLVKQAFPDAVITLTDLAGDNDHWALEIASAAFKGKSRIEQHKMVNNALGNMVGGTLHALQLKTTIVE